MARKHESAESRIAANLAKSAGADPEAVLAYPKELGVEINPAAEAEKVLALYERVLELRRQISCIKQKKSPNKSRQVTASLLRAQKALAQRWNYSVPQEDGKRAFLIREAFLQTLGRIEEQHKIHKDTDSKAVRNEYFARARRVEKARGVLQNYHKWRFEHPKEEFPAENLDEVNVAQTEVGILEAANSTALQSHPRLAAEIGFRQMVSDRKDLEANGGFVMSPSRAESLEEIKNIIVNSRQVPLVSLIAPTGTGKTVMVRALAKEFGKDRLTEVLSLAVRDDIDHKLIGHEIISADKEGKLSAKVVFGALVEAAQKGKIFLLDEATFLENHELMSVIAKFSGKRVGDFVSFSELRNPDGSEVSVEIAPGFAIILTGNLGVKHTDRKGFSDEARRRLIQIELGYVPQTPENPELFERYLLPEFLDANNRFLASQSDLALPFKEAGGYPKTIRVEKGGKACTRVLHKWELEPDNEEEKKGGSLWRLANLTADIQRRYILHKEDRGGLEKAVLTLQDILQWLKDFCEETQKNFLRPKTLQVFLESRLTKWLKDNVKHLTESDSAVLEKLLETYSFKAPQKPQFKDASGNVLSDEAIASTGTQTQKSQMENYRSFLPRFNEQHNAPFVLKNLTPEEMGFLKPSVPRMEWFNEAEDREVKGDSAQAEPLARPELPPAVAPESLATESFVWRGAETQGDPNPQILKEHAGRVNPGQMVTKESSSADIYVFKGTYRNPQKPDKTYAVLFDANNQVCRALVEISTFEQEYKLMPLVFQFTNPETNRKEILDLAELKNTFTDFFERRAGQTDLAKAPLLLYAEKLKSLDLASRLKQEHIELIQKALAIGYTRAAILPPLKTVEEMAQAVASRENKPQTVIRDGFLVLKAALADKHDDVTVSYLQDGIDWSDMEYKGRDETKFRLILYPPSSVPQDSLNKDPQQLKAYLDALANQFRIKIQGLVLDEYNTLSAYNLNDPAFDPQKLHGFDSYQLNHSMYLMAHGSKNGPSFLWGYWRPDNSQVVVGLLARAWENRGVLPAVVVEF